MSQLSKNQTVAKLIELRHVSRQTFSQHLLTLPRDEADFLDLPSTHRQERIIVDVENWANRLISTTFATMPPESAKSPEVFMALIEHLGELFEIAEGNASFRQMGRSNGIGQQRKSEIRDRFTELLNVYRDPSGMTVSNVKAASDKQLGRPSKYDWLRATNQVWGQIYRRQLIASQQSQIEQALSEALDNGPDPENCRPYAQPIWKEMGGDRQGEN